MHIPYHCVGWLMELFVNFLISRCRFASFFQTKHHVKITWNIIYYYCIIIVGLFWKIKLIYFTFELSEFYKENILTSWNICLWKKYDSFLYYFCLSMLQRELNEIWQHVEGNNTLSYFIVHLQVLSENFEKNI